MSKEHDDMKLPDGKTCIHCVGYGKCSKLVGAKEDWTSCDFYPRRFALNTRAIGLAALLKAKETIKTLHGETAWEIYDAHSPEMKLINEAIRDLLG